MNGSPLTLALVTMVTWGLWSLFATLATRTLLPETAMIVSYVVGAGVAGGYVLLTGKPIQLEGAGLGFASLAGLAVGVGSIAFYAALARGSTAVVTSVSALYFVVAALLGVVVLGDSVGATDAAAVAFAVLAVVLFSL